MRSCLRDESIRWVATRFLREASFISYNGARSVAIVAAEPAA